MVLANAHVLQVGADAKEKRAKKVARNTYSDDVAVEVTQSVWHLSSGAKAAREHSKRHPKDPDCLRPGTCGCLWALLRRADHQGQCLSPGADPDVMAA